MKAAASPAFASCARGRRQCGFAASVIVLALLAVMATLLLGISRTVAALDRELRLVEQRQLARFAMRPPGARPAETGASPTEGPRPRDAGSPAPP